MEKKVCILTTDHSALDDRIFYKEAKSLNKAGYEITLIAPLNQDGFLTDMGKNPIAKGETIIDGIKIIGFREGKHAILGLPKTWTISQLIRYTTNGMLNFGNEPYADMIEKGITVDADIYHCHELASLYAGLKIKRKLQQKGRNPKLIFDVHEYWSAKDEGSKIRESLWSKSKEIFEKKAFKHVDYFLTVNQLIRSYVLFKSGFKRTEVLYNSTDLSIFKNIERPSDKSKIIICHEGSLKFDRGLKEMVIVIKKLKERYDNFCFLIVGDVFGKEKEFLEKEIKNYGIDDVIDKTGWLPYDKVGEAIANCSIGVIFMDPSLSENIYFSTPNKLFNYMRYGLPVVTVDFPEIRRIVLNNNCGIVVKERTVTAFVDALSLLIENEELRKKMGENGKKALLERYSWEVMEGRLLRVYRELTSDCNYIM